MPRLDPIYSSVSQQGTLGVKASAADFGGQSAEAIKGAGTAIGEVADAVNRVEEQKARMRAGADLTRRDLAERQNMIAMQNDPEFAQKYGEDGSGFSEAFKNDFETRANEAIQNADPRERRYMQQGMYNLGESLYGASMEYQAKVGADFSVRTVTTAVDNASQSANMAPKQYMSIMANANMVIDQAQNIDPMKRAELKDKALQNVTLSAAMGRLTQGGAAAAQQLKSGKMMFTTIGDDGKTVTKNVRDIIDEKTFGTLDDQATRVIKEAESAAKQVRDDNISDIKTAMEFAETPDDFVSISKSIEDQAKSFTHIEANELRVMLHGKAKKVLDEIDSVNRGSNYASGAAQLNPQDNEAMKDYNLFYNRMVEPTLQDMPPEEKNTRLANLVSQSKVIPDNLKGDVHNAARSLDPKVVSDKADFIDRLSLTNPHLIKDFDQTDLARIQMVNQMLGAGYNETEAFKRVDDALNPSNAAVYDQRKEDIKEQKFPYADKAVANFDASFFYKLLPGKQGIDRDSNFAGRQVAQLTADYRNAYDTQYKLTGDKTASETFANTTVRGLYGVTDINGGDQLMRYAPEKYYSIPNIDNGWMREQVLDEAREQLGKSLTNPGTTPEKNVVLVPDPLVTPRTAKEGRPLYKLMYKQDNGELSDLLGPNKFFAFDPASERVKKLEAARDQAKNNPLDQIPTGPGVR